MNPTARLESPALFYVSGTLAYTLLALAWLADILTTTLGLHVGLVEANPVGLWVLESAGLWGMVALKSVAVVVAISGAAVCARVGRSWESITMLAAAAFVWLAASAWNLRLIAGVL